MGEVTYDPQVDVLRILLNDAPIEESDEDKPGVILDYDKDGNIGREGTERFLRNALKMRQFLVFLYAEEAGPVPSWVAGVARDGKDQGNGSNGGVECIGDVECIIDGGQEAKTESLDYAHDAGDRPP